MAKTVARRSAICLEGRRTPASIFFTVTVAQSSCCASSACVRSKSLRCCLSQLPNTLSGCIVVPSQRLHCQVHSWAIAVSLVVSRVVCATVSLYLFKPDVFHG